MSISITLLQKSFKLSEKLLMGVTKRFHPVACSKKIIPVCQRRFRAIFRNWADLGPKQALKPAPGTRSSF
jgi:hypothetical protein